MAEFFASGRAAEFVLLVLAVEAILLAWRKRPIMQIIGLLGPAALIVLALRAALIDAHWIWIATPLALAFPLHLLDLKQRT